MYYEVILKFYEMRIGGEDMTEKEINVPEKLQEIGKKIGEFKDTVVAEFKDMEVDVKNWNFAVGKAEEEYTVDVDLKLAIKPKKKE
jgi:hypothetical protein